MLNQSICVATYKGSPWLERCLNSIPSNLPLYVVRDGHYECAALRSIMEKTKLDRWLFLQDSCMVKDPSWIYEHWNEDTSIGLIQEPSLYGSYLGWWRRSILEQCHIPNTHDKLSAVLAEMELPKEYSSRDPSAYTLWPELNIQNANQELMFVGTEHARWTRRYENNFLVKNKSSWDGLTMDHSAARDERIRQLNP